MKRGWLADSAIAAIGPPTILSRLVDGTAGPPDRPYLETLDWSGSADLRTVARADGFAVFPAGDRDYAPGEIVGFLPIVACDDAGP